MGLDGDIQLHACVIVVLGWLFCESIYFDLTSDKVGLKICCPVGGSVHDIK